MSVLALDPGPARTAWCSYGEGGVEAGILDNNKLLINCLPFGEEDVLAVEMVASYGMPVGREVFETCAWIGRFVQAWEGTPGTGHPATHALVYRKDVKMHLCGRTAGVNDAVVRRALLDLFPRTGGGKTPQIGTKAQPGPLYGFKADMWAALGVAVTYAAAPGKFQPLGS